VIAIGGIETTVGKEDLRQHIANLVTAYEEILASIGAPKLTEEQREALKAFLMLVYEESLKKQEQAEN
jgi:formiminotetrahydrofolate cyclodeaminase